jgi:hypothetical protein
MLPRNLPPEHLEKSSERNTMNESRTITIELPSRDWQLLEAEALAQNCPPSALIETLVETHLRESQSSQQTQIEPSLTENLNSLRSIAKRQPVIDAVQLARESREDLIQRGIF